MACIRILAAHFALAALARKLVWSDEFDACEGEKGDRPRSDNWVHEHGFVRNQELQWYQEDNARCVNGELVITAERVWDMPNPNYVEGSSDWKTSRKWINYTSSALESIGLRNVSMGSTMEMRAKIDIRKGSWPAWWAKGSNNPTHPWPSCGEIDMMEYYNTLMHGNVMTSRGQWTTKTIVVDDAWASDYHVWEMVWAEDRISLAIDGVALNDYVFSQAPDKGATFDAAHPIYLIFNQAIGSTAGDPAGTTFPVLFNVDYLRVYDSAPVAALV